MDKFKKTIIFLSLTLILLSVTADFIFAKELEIKYPEVPGAEAPTTTGTRIEEYIRYIFALAIRIAGFIVFGVMVYGGIRYVLSQGSPAAMADARKTILGAFLGIVILLSSYLILKTINPAILSIKLEKEPTIDCGLCDLSQLSDPSTDNPVVTCTRCKADPYGRQTCPDPALGDTCTCGKPEWVDPCREINDPFRFPGVYLVKVTEGEEVRVYLTDSQPELTNLTNKITNQTIDLNDKLYEAEAGYVRFGRNNDNSDEQYCAILFEDENYQGAARILCADNSIDFKQENGPMYTVGMENAPPLINTGFVSGASSILVFQLNLGTEGPQMEGENVGLYRTPGRVGNPFLAYTTNDAIETTNFFDDPTPFDDPDRWMHNIYSIKINGNLLVLLCGEDHRDETEKAKACLPFSKSYYFDVQHDITHTLLGKCDPFFLEGTLYAMTSSCVESVIVFKVK